MHNLYLFFLWSSRIIGSLAIGALVLGFTLGSFVTGYQVIIDPDIPGWGEACILILSFGVVSLLCLMILDVIVNSFSKTDWIDYLFFIVFLTFGVSFYAGAAFAWLT